MDFYGEDLYYKIEDFPNSDTYLLFYGLLSRLGHSFKIKEILDRGNVDLEYKDGGGKTVLGERSIYGILR